jgi:hypothetical protein
MEGHQGPNHRDCRSGVRRVAQDHTYITGPVAHYCPNDAASYMMRALAANKALSFVVIFAIAVLAGCSSSPPVSSPTTGTHLTGTMGDWVNAMCTKIPLPMNRGTMLGNSATTPTVCPGVVPGSPSEIPIYIGTYPSESSMENDLNPYMTGPYAEGNNGSEVVVFVSLPIPSGASAVFQPLEAYGFTIHQLRNLPVVPPSTQTPPGNTNAMPTPTAVPPDPRSTAQSPPGTINPVPTPNSGPPTTTAQPYWDGPWLRNYSEGDQDCNAGGLDYWVVQPGGDTDMYALKKGCFPQNWVNIVNSHCQSYVLPKGQCAVWDQDSIMSTFGKHGDLLIVALTQTCLDRAGLPDFHEGPLHQDCVVHP